MPDHQVKVLHARRPAPPMGMRELPVPVRRTDPFTFDTGDMLLLYTDGVIEARSPTGACYPLAERVASFPTSSSDALLRHVQRDPLAHIGEQPADDAAPLAIERTPSHHLNRPHITAHPVNGHHRLRPSESPPPTAR
ncbi:SpoIIE family protein phosphatase [Streptomyces sp. NPDC020096]